MKHPKPVVVPLGGILNPGDLHHLGPVGPPRPVELEAGNRRRIRTGEGLASIDYMNRYIPGFIP